MKATKKKKTVSKRKRANLTKVKKSVKEKFSKPNMIETMKVYAVHLLKEERVKDILDSILMEELKDIFALDKKFSKRVYLSSFLHKLFTLSDLMKRSSVVSFSKQIQALYKQDEKKFVVKKKLDKDFTVIPSGRRKKQDVNFK